VVLKYVKYIKRFSGDFMVGYQANCVRVSRLNFRLCVLN